MGPEHWDDIGFPTCGQSSSQSPVSILTGEVAAYRGAPLLMRHESSELVVRNTGHVIEAPIATGAHDTLQGNGDCYQLVQYHFHAPSKHAVNGQRADVEAHLVHRNAQGGTAVVGVPGQVISRREPTASPLPERENDLPDAVGATVVSLLDRVGQLERNAGHEGRGPHRPEHGVWRGEDFTEVDFVI